jgi:hypothetical protein
MRPIRGNHTAASLWPIPPAGLAIAGPSASPDSEKLLTAIDISPRIPRVRWPGTALRANASSGLRAQAVFCDHRFQHLAVKTQVSDQTLEAGVLIFQGSQTLRVVHFHASESGLPHVDRVLRNTAFSRHVLCLAAHFHLLQRSDDLRPCACSCSSLSSLKSETILTYVRIQGGRSRRPRVPMTAHRVWPSTRPTENWQHHFSYWTSTDTEPKAHTKCV